MGRLDTHMGSRRHRDAPDVGYCAGRTLPFCRRRCAFLASRRDSGVWSISGTALVYQGWEGVVRFVVGSQVRSGCQMHIGTGTGIVVPPAPEPGRGLSGRSI